MKFLNNFEWFMAYTLLAVGLVFVPPAAFSQNQSPKNSQPDRIQPPNSPPQRTDESSVTRDRRVLPQPPDQQTAESSPTPAATIANSPTGQAAVAVDSEIQAMRDEINASPDGPERSRLQLKLVAHLVTKGMKQEAIAELQSMSHADRFDPSGFYNIANAQARLGDSESAVNTYRKAIEQRKGRYSRALNNLGVVLLRLGRWDEAYDAFMSAMRFEGFRYAEASYNLGRLYLARGENDLAVREWRRALKVDPEHTAASTAIANIGGAGSITVAGRASRSGGGDVEEESLNKERARTKSDSERAAARDEHFKTRIFATRASRTFTVDRETYALLQRGRAAREKGRHEDAADNYRRVLTRLGGYFPPANLELGYALIALRKIEEAIASFLPVASKDGDRFPISYYHLARLYELRGELKLAEENYARAAEAYGESNPQFLLDLSRVREKLGDPSGALASLEKYLRLLEAQGNKPAWSVERLATLRLKVSQSVKKEP